nr:hypothetical protein [Planctomycetota bacterium]
EPTLEALLLQCLAKKPGERPGTANALLHALEQCPDCATWTPEDAQAWWIKSEPVLGIPEPLPHAESASTFFASPGSGAGR